MKTATLAVLVGALQMASGAGAQTTQSQRFTVPLSDPSQPVVVEASLMHGSIKAVAYEGSEVVVEAEYEQKDEEIVEVDGMKRIPSSSMAMTIEEQDNVVSIDTDWSNEEMFLSLKVPARTSLRLSAVNGEYIEVEGVEGEHELSHTNGSITASDVRGSVLADTTNGDVVVKLLEVTPDTPMSFATFNGKVDITLPPTLNAEVRMKSAQGDVFTDFDIALLPNEPEITREEGKRGYRVRMEQEVRGTIGTGGPELTFQTFHGQIYLRKLK